MEIKAALYAGPSPRSPEQINGIIEELYKLYPDARYDLNFSTPLEMFVATQLAAQCTDVRVNSVTTQLFQKYQSTQDYASVSQEEFEEDIKKITFYRNKAKNIRAACQYLIIHHQGEIPRTMAELVKIPGVARKTANVVLGNAFGISEGFIVDTHVNRLVQRFGWTEHDDPVKQEQDLMRIIPQKEWLGLAHRIIYHGRAVCDARKPKCSTCTLISLCPSSIPTPK